jgi:hypothetical protein
MPNPVKRMSVGRPRQAAFAASLRPALAKQFPGRGFD